MRRKYPNEGHLVIIVSVLIWITLRWSVVLQAKILEEFFSVQYL